MCMQSSKEGTHTSQLDWQVCTAALPTLLPHRIVEANKNQKLKSMGSKFWSNVCERKDVSRQSLVSCMVLDFVFEFDKRESYSYPARIRRFTVPDCISSQSVLSVTGNWVLCTMLTFYHPSLCRQSQMDRVL